MGFTVSSAMNDLPAKYSGLGTPSRILLALSLSTRSPNATADGQIGGMIDYLAQASEICGWRKHTGFGIWGARRSPVDISHTHQMCKMRRGRLIPINTLSDAADTSINTTYALFFFKGNNLK